MKKVLIFFIIICLTIFIVSMVYNYNNYENEIEESKETSIKTIYDINLSSDSYDIIDTDSRRTKK